jgi:hypothetical protein
MRHKPTALERTVILMIEGAGVVPTGDEAPAPSPSSG